MIRCLIFLSIFLVKTSFAIEDHNDRGLFFLPIGTDKAFVAPALKTSIDIKIEGLFVNTTIRQHFLNPTNDWLEAIYLFPLPIETSVDRLRMRIGNRFIEGKIEEKVEAERIYNKAKVEGKKTSLISKTKENIFRTNVANIGPGELIIVEIKFQDRVLMKDSEYSYRLPTVIPPRYLDITTINSDNESSGKDQIILNEEIKNISKGKPTFISPIRDPIRPSINPYTVNIDLNSGFEIDYVKSLYHEIIINDLGKKHKNIKLANKKMPSIKDFVLTWKPVISKEAQLGVFAQEWNSDTYLYLNFFPPKKEMNYIANSTPRDLILVLDTSGSMAGRSLVLLKESLNELLNMIDENTRINIITFNDSNHKLFMNPRYANNETKNITRRYIDKIEAFGGTNMMPAISRALDTVDMEGRLTQVVALTDGNIANPSIMLKMIEKYLGKKRLFMVGIGSAPNDYVIKEASKIGRGTSLNIGILKETKKRMVSLFNKIQYPAILDLNINMQNIVNKEQFPKKLPDLYYDEPFTSVIKLKNKQFYELPNKFIISGKMNGQVWEKLIEKKDIKFSKNIHKLFAIEKIFDTNIDYRKGKIDYSTKKMIIKNIGLDYQILTEYTSLVAVNLNKDRPTSEIIKSHQLEQNLPDGWNWEDNEEIQQIKNLIMADFKLINSTPQNILEESTSPIILTMAQTSTPSNLFFFLSFILMGISFICLIKIKNK